MIHSLKKITALTVIFVSFLLPTPASAQGSDSFVETSKQDEPATPIHNKAFFKYEFNKRLKYKLIYDKIEDRGISNEVNEVVEYYTNETDPSVLSFNNSRNGVIYNLNKDTNPVLPVLIKDESKDIKPGNFDYFKGDIPLESEIADIKKRKKIKTDQVLELVEKKAENDIIHYKYNLIRNDKGKTNLGVIELDITNSDNSFNNNILYDMEPLFFKNKIIFDKGEIKSYSYYSSAKKRTKYYESMDTDSVILKLSFTKGCCVSSLE
jgi:lipopolysaccharide export LptBFGC system permease protein LptF